MGLVLSDVSMPEVVKNGATAALRKYIQSVSAQQEVGRVAKGKEACLQV